MIAKHVLRTKDCGIVFSENKEKEIESFVVAYFSGGSNAGNSENAKKVSCQELDILSTMLDVQ